MPALKDRYDFTYKGYPIAATLDRIDSRRLADRDEGIWGVWRGNRHHTKSKRIGGK